MDQIPAEPTEQQHAATQQPPLGPPMPQIFRVCFPCHGRADAPVMLVDATILTTPRTGRYVPFLGSLSANSTVQRSPENIQPQIRRQLPHQRRRLVILNGNLAAQLHDSIRVACHGDLPKALEQFLG